MKLSPRETYRWCVVEHATKFNKKKIREEILDAQGVQTDFTIITVPAPPRDQTLFKVYGNDREVLVAIALVDTVATHIAYEAKEMHDGVEILFDPHQDRMGWFQFGLSSEGEPTTEYFLPYPEAHSTKYPLLRLKKWEVDTEIFPSGSRVGFRCRWFFATFDAREVFRYGQTVGFNICRTKPLTGEFSSWNYLSGNGSQDAAGFGTLHRDAPGLELRDIEASFEGNRLRLAGTAKGRARKLELQVFTPLGGSFVLPVDIEGGRWETDLALSQPASGRYRLQPLVKHRLVEPVEWTFDLPRPGASRSFITSITSDSPMCVWSNYYTPERLANEMKLISSLGIERVNWIEYPADWESFWEYSGWSKHYKKTKASCGDLFTAAVRAAHQSKVEIFANFKVFDTGFNVFFPPRTSASTIKDLENRNVALLPEIVRHQEWTMQSNPAWQKTTEFPITRLRLYSENPIAAIDPKRLRLMVSSDNLEYRRYKGKFSVAQGALRRSHYRWTPAGKLAESGSTRNWYIELTGLNLRDPFAALVVEGEEVPLVHRGFMLVEAQDASGGEAPVTVATKGHRDFKDPGYFFWKEWPGWANYTEPILQQRKWTGHDLGMTFQQHPNMPTMQEPTYEGTRDLWLARLQSFLDAGADGISFRTLCHHNGAMSWLQYAFAPVVCETFESLYGRQPETTPDDYERIRRIRGDAFTQFLRDAKKLTSRRGRRLSAQIESGGEIPPHLDTRMQIFLDYRTWLEEGILDEAETKWSTAQSTYIHREILPLARRRGIPVHIISRCLTNGLDYTAMETTPQLLIDAYNAGFSGYNYYETQNLIEMAPTGRSVAKGYAEPALVKAHNTLQSLLEG